MMNLSLSSFQQWESTTSILSSVSGGEFLIRIVRMVSTDQDMFWNMLSANHAYTLDLNSRASKEVRRPSVALKADQNS